MKGIRKFFILFLQIFYNFENMSKLKILRVIPTAFKGNHVKFKEVYMKKCRSIHIRADEALYIHSDGEVPGKAKELTLSCMKQALTLYL